MQNQNEAVKNTAFDYRKAGILCLAWLIAVLLFTPFFCYVAGLALNAMMPITPAWRLLHIVFFVSCGVVTIGVYLLKSHLLRIIPDLLLDRQQVIIVLLFAACVAMPRMIVMSPSYALAVYDDIWHYQKIVSVFGTFPDLKHYYFPDLTLSYYFYSYVIPAVFYTLLRGPSLKIIWLVYIFAVTVGMSLLILSCLKAFLPKNKKAGLFLALALTFLGGLHEWPEIISSWFANKSYLHTEWWGLKIGLHMQVSSFYTINYWAPQHLCGLGLFCLILYLLYTTKGPMKWYTCGALIGIAMGFSVYIAAFTCLYVGILLAFKLPKKPRDAILSGVKLIIGLAFTFLPILKYYLNRKQSVFLTDNWAAHKFPFFLLAEFGIAAVLFCVYAYRVFSRKRPAELYEKVNVVFVIACLIVLFCVKSEGFNVIFFRGIIAAELLILFSAVLMLSELELKKHWLKCLIYAVLIIQLTGFLPEMLAMSKQSVTVRRSWPPIPEYIQEINASSPFESILDFKYEPGVKTQTVESILLSIFRMKNVAKRYALENGLNSNNLVYLNETDKRKLFRKSPSASQK